jgi:hypothetical protein
MGCNWGMCGDMGNKTLYMLKDQCDQYGIIDWLSTEMDINDYCSCSDRDPQLIAELMSYDFAGNKPCEVFMYITAKSRIMPLIVVFKDYKSKVRFVIEDQIKNISL